MNPNTQDQMRPGTFDLTSEENSSRPQEDPPQTETSNSESFTGIRKNLFYERYQNLTIQSRNNIANVFCTEKDFLTSDQASLYQRLLQNSAQMMTLSNCQSFEDKTQTLDNLDIQQLRTITSGQNNFMGNNSGNADKSSSNKEPISNSVRTSHMSLQLLQSPFLSHDT